MKTLVIVIAVLSITLISLLVLGSRIRRGKESESNVITDTNSAYWMGYAAGLKSGPPPGTDLIPTPPELTNWPQATRTIYRQGYAEGWAAREGK